MNRNRLLHKSARIAALLLAAVLASCGSAPAAESTQSAAQPGLSETVTASSSSAETAPAFSLDGITAAAASEKEETVNVKTEPDGTVRKTTVTATLHPQGSGDYIRDFSSLKEIRNTDGDEEYVQNGTELIWENHGADITYKGTYEGDLPVGLSVTGYLDGKRTPLPELKGKSGQIRLVFDYRVLETEHVAVGDTETEIESPWIFVTAAVIPEEALTDIEVTNGTIASVAGRTAVIGFAAPNLEKALRLTGFEPTKDIELPDHFELTGTASEFSIDFMMTIVTRGFFGELESDDLQKLDDLKSDMQEFSDAGDELVDGVSQLKDGADTFGGYLKTYTDGAAQLDAGVGQLKDGAAKITANNETLTSGAKALSDGLSQLNDAASSVDLSMINSINPSVFSVLDLTPYGLNSQDVLDLIAQANALQAAVKQLNDGAAQLSEGIKAYTDGVSQLEEGIGQVAEGSGKLSSAGKELTDGYGELTNGMNELLDGVKKFNDEGIGELEKLTGDSFDDVVFGLKALREADLASHTLTGTAEGTKGSVMYLFDTDGI